jgi:ParB family chromosome partitioning protein
VHSEIGEHPVEGVPQEVVRKEWLAAFLSRRTLPKNALAFAATVLVENTGQVRSALDGHHAVALELLGYEYKWGTKSPLTTLIQHNPAKTGTVLLAVALGALEGDTSKNTWRSPDADDVAYFTALQGWGYTLSEVEHIVLGIHPEPEASEEDAESAEDAAASDEATGPESDMRATVGSEPSESDAESEPDDADQAQPVEQDTDGD